MKLKLWCAGMITAAILAGCAGIQETKTTVRQSANGTEQTLSAGKIFEIVLPANPTTGYEWHVSRLDRKYFRVADSGYTPAASRRIGRGGTQWWKIKTLKPGKSDISLLYYRIWEGPEKAIEKYSVIFIITPRI